MSPGVDMGFSALFFHDTVLCSGQKAYWEWTMAK